MRQWIVKHNKTLVLALASLGVSLILLNIDFKFLEASLYDLRVTNQSTQNEKSNIVLITLDDATTQALNEISPLPLDLHVKFLEELASYSPRGVGYLIDMTQVNQIDPDLFSTTWGDRFVQIAKQFERSGVPFIMGTPYELTGEVLPPFPLSALDHSIAAILRDETVFSDDRVTRRAFTYLYNRPTFHIALPKAMGLIKDHYTPRGSSEAPEMEGEWFYFRYRSNTSLQALDSGNTPYKKYSFLDVIQKKLPLNALKNKVILVGSLSRENPSDFVRTPYLKSSFSNPNLLVHAQIIDSVIHNDGIVPAPNWINALNTVLVTFCVFWAVMNLTPLFSVFTTLGVASVFLATGYFFFQGYGGSTGYWIPLAQPLVGILASFYLAVPYRLIREYHKRWDFQKKHDILLQVEGLKTNFLSLVTHDLKTPVARIQGLAELLLSKRQPKDKPAEIEPIQNIIRATDELNNFITSILELSKIQSNELRINFESKDINQIIERAIERFEPLASKKSIQIKPTLEPLFPIKVDPNLISKVIHNLIDNAIKYSPEGSQIAVETRETEKGVEIRVADQGVGLSAEDLHQLFTKFFRAKNDATTKVSGTGLGLYLSKYFIEAHHGSLSVESELGKGSTFIIQLPLEASSKPQGARSKFVDTSTIPGLRVLRRVSASRIKLSFLKSREKGHV